MAGGGEESRDSKPAKRLLGRQVGDDHRSRLPTELQIEFGYDQHRFAGEG